ncbi:hypothetical protein J6590_032207, partial [Homalodisca vitripennis]
FNDDCGITLYSHSTLKTFSGCFHHGTVPIFCRGRLRERLGRLDRGNDRATPCVMTATVSLRNYGFGETIL